MMERQNHLDKIIELLSFLKAKVELSNPSNLTDVNIYSENFYRDLLNLVYGYNLININIIEQNAAAIDLGDEAQKIAIQVTSTSALSKTKKTVSAFIKKNLHNKYDRLVIFNITTKANHQDSFVGDKTTHQLNTKDDIWDISTIIKDISDFPLDKIKAISSFLQAEIKFSPDQTLAKEIKTFTPLSP